MNYRCSAIDAGLFVYNDGGVKTCCSGNFNFGSIRNQPIRNIFSSELYLEVKKSLANNQPHDYCKGCYNIEQTAPGSSQKTAFDDLYPVTDGTRKIKLADVRWSDVCNLTCRYCNINDSSEWKKLRNIPIETVNKSYIDSLFDEITENKDNIDRLYLLGGEPLMQKHNERLLDIVNKNVFIDVLTNGSVPNLENNKVYQKLKNFRKVYWNLSFDNVGDRFEYVRAGANWNTLVANIHIMIKDFGTNAVTIHPVYTLWNALNIRELYDFAEEMGGLRVNWQLGLPKEDEWELATDSFLTFGHNSKIINAAIAEIDSLEYKDDFLLGVRDSLTKDSAKTNKANDFFTWTKKMENLIPPKHTFKELWPELNTLLTDNE